ncbi:MAG: Sec-independent protein translocase subunit TatB [Actinomycetota bacterium]|nr:Sec-independent protein translocase subunit TatB [Actinomycetota bacterium]
MFDSVGLSEIMVLLLGALFIFGPDRLPSLARDAAGALKRLRQTVTGARGQIHDQLGPDFDHLKDVDLRSLNPKTFIRKHLLEDEPSPPIRRRSATSGSRTRTTEQETATSSAAAGTPVAVGAAGSAATNGSGAAYRLEPPFDAEAT